jgi:hypothetical protein
MIINQPSLTWNGTLKQRISTDFLIFHHAEASVCSVEDIHSWHQAPPREWIGVGYNFVIRKDGSVWEGRPIWAADADAYGYNNNSISCCFEGNFDNERMTDAQIKSGIDLARYCRKLYPKIRLMRHRDVNDTRCPGENFDNRIIFEGSVDIVKDNTDTELIGIIEVLATYTDTDGSPLLDKEYWLKNTKGGGQPNPFFVGELIKKLSRKILI